MTPEPQDDLARAHALLAQAEEDNNPAMIELGDGELFLGWHPMLGRFSVSRRAENAPPELPAYMAWIDEARHVHAGGETHQDAASALLALVGRVADRLAEESP